MSPNVDPKLIKITLILLFSVLLVHILTAAKDFLSPLALGALFAYMIYPLVHFLEKNNIPRILSIMLGILLIVVLAVAAGFLMFKQLENMLTDIPALKKQAMVNIDHFEQFIEDTFGVSTSKQNVWLKSRVNELFRTGSNFAKATFNATASTFFKIGMLPVFVFYLLHYREQLEKFLLKIVPEYRLKETRAFIHDSSFIAQRYMSGVFSVVLILSIINSLGLYFIGLKYAIAFGIISAAFNFIPYFGTWIGAVFPFTFALISSPDPNMALYVILFFAAIQFTENNILTPNITGAYVRLNPLFTILGLIAGGMIWGLIGMFVVIPLLAVLRVIMGHFDELKPYAYVMGIEGNRKNELRWLRIKAFFSLRRRRREKYRNEKREEKTKNKIRD